MIRAELFRSSICAVSGSTITAIATAPVLLACRQLVEAGYPSTAAMEVYRGDVVALRVRTIGEAANLEISDRGFTRRQGGGEGQGSVILSSA
jgi:hypothetical protein